MARAPKKIRASSETICPGSQPQASRSTAFGGIAFCEPQSRASDCCFTNGQKEIVDLYDYPADRIEIVHNGVPLGKFRFDSELREKSRVDLKLKPDQVALLFAGSGWERKGLVFAIQAMALCKNKKMRLLVAGRGNAASYKTKRLRFWREEPVQFLGEVADLVRVYAAADIFILPTIYDPFSNACLEALACGLPLITTRSNGFSEIIENGVHGSIV